MATELEQRLRDSLEHAARRFPPPPDLRDRVDERAARHERRRRTGRLAAAAAAAVVVGASAVLLAGGGDDGDGGGKQRVAVGPRPAEPAEPVDGWPVATSPALGWRYEHPPGWTVQEFSGRCKVGFSGTMVSNLDRPLIYQPPSSGCTTPWDLAEVPENFVAVEMSHMALRPVFGRVSTDTAFPLSTSTMGPLPPEVHPPQAPGRVMVVTVGGDAGYRVVVWQGRGASPDDLGAVERIVASITPGAGGQPASPAPVECPADLAEPVVVSGQVCAPEAPAGNGLGEDGVCTGEEAVPPCGAGAEVGRYYPYTLPLRCDGLAVFDGRRWVSGLPPPADGGTIHVWMRLDPSGTLRLASPLGAITFDPDTGQAPKGCRGLGG